MATCTGCGLRVLADGTLIVDAADGDDWPFAQCDVEDGMPVYCGTDGRLYGPPEHSAVSVFSGFESDAFDGPGYGEVAPSSWVCGTPAVVTIENPYCRDINLHLQFGLSFGILAEPGSMPLFGYRRDLDGSGMTGEIPINSPMAPVFPNPNSPAPNQATYFGAQEERDFFDFVVPANSTRSVTAVACVGNFNPIAEVGAPQAPVRIVDMGVSVRAWGGTTSMMGAFPDGVLT